MVNISLIGTSVTLIVFAPVNTSSFENCVIQIAKYYSTTNPAFYIRARNNGSSGTWTAWAELGGGGGSSITTPVSIANGGTGANNYNDAGVNIFGHLDTPLQIMAGFVNQSGLKTAFRDISDFLSDNNIVTAEENIVSLSDTVTATGRPCIIQWTPSANNQYLVLPSYDNYENGEQVVVLARIIASLISISSASQSGLHIRAPRATGVSNYGFPCFINPTVFSYGSLSISGVIPPVATMGTSPGSGWLYYAAYTFTACDTSWQLTSFTCRGAN